MDALLRADDAPCTLDPNLEITGRQDDLVWTLP
jgi:hypothetical protein